MNILKIRSYIEKHSLIFFVILTCLSSWFLWSVPNLTFGNHSFEIKDHKWLIVQLGFLTPSITAILFSAILKQSIFYFVKASFIILPIILLGYWIAECEPNGILAPTINHTGFVLVSAIFIIIIFSTKQTLFTDITIIIKPTSVRNLLITLSVFFYPIMFTLIWLFVSSFNGYYSVSFIKNNFFSSISNIILIFTFITVFGSPLGEEIGWRGFVLPRLLSKNNPLKASLIFGVLMWLWYLPFDLKFDFIFYGMPSVAVRFLSTIPLSVIFTWFYLRSGRYLLVTLLLNTSINILPELGFYYYKEALVLFLLFNIVLATILGYELDKISNSSNYKC